MSQYFKFQTPFLGLQRSDAPTLHHPTAPPTRITPHVSPYHGFRSFIAYNPKAGTGVVVLSNTFTLAGVVDLGIHVVNSKIPLANPEEIDAVGACLFHHGIYVTMAVPPLVPEGQASFRLQISAVNTWEQIEQLVSTLGELSDRFRLQSAVAA